MSDHYDDFYTPKNDGEEDSLLTEKASSTTVKNEFNNTQNKYEGRNNYHKKEEIMFVGGDGSEIHSKASGSSGVKETPLKNPFDTQVGGSHYKKEGVMDVTEWCMSHNLDIGEFNIIKYVFRHEKKNGIEDLRKARHYLEMIAYKKYKENL